MPRRRRTPVATDRPASCGRIRAFRADDSAALAAARADAALAEGWHGPADRDAIDRAVRAERRRQGGPGYDLLRHLGLVRRLKRAPQSPT